MSACIFICLYSTKLVRSKVCVQCMVNSPYCKSGYLRIGGNYASYVVTLNFASITPAHMVKKKNLVWLITHLYS